MAIKSLKPAPAAAKATLEAVLDSVEGAERGRMFGYDAAFLNGHFVIGLHERGLVMRLPESARNEFMARYGQSAWEPAPAQPTREHVIAPDRLLAVRAELRQWIGRAVSYARTLPPRIAANPRRPDVRNDRMPQRNTSSSNERRPQREPKLRTATPGQRPVNITTKKRPGQKLNEPEV